MTNESPRPDPALIDAVRDYLRQEFSGDHIEHHPVSGAEQFEVRRRWRLYLLRLGQDFFARLHQPAVVTAWLRGHDVARTLDRGKSGEPWQILDPDRPGVHPAEILQRTAQSRCPDCRSGDVAHESTSLDPLPELEHPEHYCECRACGARFICFGR